MRVAVLGAGYAGLTLVRKLERSLPEDVEIVLVDESSTHLVQHELHRVVRRPSLAEDITVPLEAVVDRATVRTARVTTVDPDANRATLADGDTLEYDVGAVCLGARTAFYDLPGVEDHATPLKRLDHAQTIREQFLACCERAPPSDPGASSERAETDGVPDEPLEIRIDEIEDDQETVANGDERAGELRDGTDEADERPDWADGERPRVVVGGAGLSGIQVAGELAALAREQNADVAVTLLERLESVAPRFPENFQAAVRSELEDRGVEVRTDTPVAGATDEAIELAGGTPIAYDQFVWTGGIAGPDALRGDRPETRSTLRLGGDTFVVGDAARVVDAEGEAVPASAQSAVREARIAAENVRRLVAAREDGIFEPRLEPFRFDSPGWLVSVGDGAVAQVGPTVFTGRAALALKTTVGAGYLSSVGAIRKASELVAEELNLAVGADPGREMDAHDGSDGEGAGDGSGVEIDVEDSDS